MTARSDARPWQPTLRTRLTLVYGGVFLAAGLLLLGVTYLLFDQQLSRSSPIRMTRLESAPEGPTRVAFVTRDGDTLTGPAALEWVEAQQQEIRSAASTSLLTQGAIALIAVGGLAGLFGWLVAGRMLAPLHRVTDTARRIASAPAADRGLHERICLDGPDDEVKELADTFDAMLERLDHSFDGQRRFVANASHELRTPLTLNRALVEVAMHRRTASDDVKQLGESLLEINDRHERLITGLLLLARSEQELVHRTPVDLEDVVEHVVGQTSAEAVAASVIVDVEVGPAPTVGDALLLERAVHNLVENGIRHNVRDGTGWLRVASRIADGVATVEVSNSGPTVPPYDVPALFEPFRRLGPDRTVSARGAGLGLSIARSVVRAHGGRISAAPRDDGGLTVTMRLPADTNHADLDDTVKKRQRQCGGREGRSGRRADEL
jgi:signal transduction histidine kinase